MGFHRRNNEDYVCYSILNVGKKDENQWALVREAMEQWLSDENFDEQGVQKRRLEEIREELGRK